MIPGLYEYMMYVALACTESHIERVVLHWFGLYKWLQGIVTSVVKKRDLTIIFMVHEALYETWRKTIWSYYRKEAVLLWCLAIYNFELYWELEENENERLRQISLDSSVHQDLYL